VISLVGFKLNYACVGFNVRFSIMFSVEFIVEFIIRFHE
jgi:hypothetical protein